MRPRLVVQAEESARLRKRSPHKVIGVEIRLKDRLGLPGLGTGNDQPVVEEIKMVALNLEIPSHPRGGQGWSMPITVHTSKGDVNGEIVLPF